MKIQYYGKTRLVSAQGEVVHSRSTSYKGSLKPSEAINSHLPSLLSTLKRHLIPSTGMSCSQFYVIMEFQKSLSMQSVYSTTTPRVLSWWMETSLTQYKFLPVCYRGMFWHHSCSLYSLTTWWQKQLRTLILVWSPIPLSPGDTQSKS